MAMRYKQNNSAFLLLLLTLGIFVVLITFLEKPKQFSGQRAYRDVEIQVEFGPRTPGSSAHELVISYITNELAKAGWKTEIQEAEWHGHEIRNIRAFRDGTNVAAGILLGAHYDSRLLADLDVNPLPGQAVPGANDGASGVAILLELARTLPSNTVPVELIFFDAEDNGNIEDWDWIIGSRLFVENMTESPKAVVIVDMVGDKDLNIYFEKNSDPTLVNEIWSQAALLGYIQFIPEHKYSILDDHFPFLEKGIPAVDIIDFDYPYYHTSADTTDKVSPESLEAVGRTLYEWILSR